MKPHAPRHHAYQRVARATLLLVLALGAITTGARADLKVPALFTDHMVLQRDLANKVWGWANPGDEVQVAIGTQKKTAKAADDGAWSLQLDPLPAGGPHTLTIATPEKTLTIQDVLVGEVWICSGQSNMQWDLGAVNDADLEILTAKLPRVRLISVPQVGTQDPKTDFNGKWELATPETARQFSAVGFLFGRQLYQTIDVPIGLIDNAWGGSAAEAWVRRDKLESDPKFASLLARWKEMETAFADANAPADRKKQLEGQMDGNSRPANIYNGVLKPTIGYGIRGAIWYQGESNAGRAYQYRDLFPLMIQSWRDEWGIGDFPFYWVQLADFLAEKPEPGDSAWAELREAQTLTLDRLPATGQAVIIDIGEGKDIHPTNKLDVARRLARWALADVYGINVAHQSPRYKAMKVEGNKAILTFDHVGGGLKTFDVDDARGFAVAGDDKVWHWAQAKVTAPDTIEVTCDAVSVPVAVRYGWADNPVVNVYSRERLPLTPFRTDDWPGVTAEAK